MSENTDNTHYVPDLTGLPREYHRLEQCQAGLGWNAYAHAQANEQCALEHLYADLLDRADAESVADSEA